MGIACMPREFVKEELKSGVLKEIKVNPELPTRAIGLALPKGQVMSFAVKEFINMVNGEGEKK